MTALRCRIRKSASTLRCMAREAHEGQHWAWNGDILLTWTDADASPVRAPRRTRPDG